MLAVTSQKASLRVFSKSPLLVQWSHGQPVDWLAGWFDDCLALDQVEEPNSKRASQAAPLQEVL